MKIDIPRGLKEKVEKKAKEMGFATPSEYVRYCIRNQLREKEG